MGTHDYTTEACNGNFQVLEGCRYRFEGLELPSSISSYPKSEFFEEHLFEIISFNSVIGNLGSICSQIDLAYQSVRNEVVKSDVDSAAKLEDPLSDIAVLTNVLNNMTSVMSGTDGDWSNFDYSSNSTMSNIIYGGIADIRLSDYVAYDDETGKYTYDNDKIKELLLSKNLCGGSRINSPCVIGTGWADEDIYIIEKILYTCVSSSGVNSDELEQIFKSSMDMDSESYDSLWSRISSDISAVANTAFNVNASYLNDSSNEGKEDYKALVNINSLKDIVNAFYGFSDDISEIQSEKGELESELEKLKMSDKGLTFDVNIFGFDVEIGGALLTDREKAVKARIEQLENKIGNYNDLDLKITYNSGSTKNEGGHYKITLNDDTKANGTSASIYEYSSDTNRTLMGAKIDITKDDAIQALESLKTDADMYDNYEDYMNAKITEEEKSAMALKVAKSVPVVGEYVTLVDDAVTIIEGVNDKISETSTAKEDVGTAKSVTSVEKTITSKIEGDDGKTASNSVGAVGTVIEAYDTAESTKEKYEKEWENGKAYNDEIDKKIKSIKNGNATGEYINQVISANTVNHEKENGTSYETANKELFSFTIYKRDDKRQVKISDNRIAN